MGRENIEKFSARYALFKSAVAFWHDNIFYRKIIILGSENINPADHLIFAPNHQNALMDALAVLFTHKGQPVFLARADIFRNKTIASLLYFLKILPVYRIRDGFSTLKSNDDIFLKTIDVLRNKNGLVILPEGDHVGFRRLRQLKKGICRVAFQADEATGFNLNIKIIPVGIEFSNYTRLRQVLTVIYGKPIEVSEYYNLYRASPEKALNELRTRIASEMKKLIVHIESEDDYEAIDELRSIINGKYSDDIKFPKLFRDRLLIDRLNELKIKDRVKYSRICLLSTQVRDRANDLNVKYRLLEKKKHPLGWLIAGLIGLFLTLPIWLFGNVFTLTFLSLGELQIKKTKDLQFHSTVRFGISLALAFIFLPVYLIVCFVIFKPWWLAILVFLTIPVAGIFTWNYNFLFRRIIGGFRVKRYIRKRNPEYLTLKNDYDELTEIISVLKDEK
ncbi:MAG: 1-acyl-sn-glycerol-3-phosphate acyltransferase [Bacteroidota bacterium]|nr:1-acyl-sn-glycerol-3-phosphate acyltransferase [Bacteroidota bacterium]